MELVIAALLAGGFLTLTAHLWRRSQAAKEGREPRLLAGAEPERSLDALVAGDVLVYGARDLIVSEVWLLEREAQQWREYRLDEEGETRWLVADRRDADGVRLGSPVELEGLEVPSEALDYEGAIFQLEASGQVMASQEGGPRLEVAFWDYADAGGPRIWLRRGGGLSVVCAGERVRRHLIDVLPGS